MNYAVPYRFFYLWIFMLGTISYGYGQSGSIKVEVKITKLFAFEDAETSGKNEYRWNFFLNDIKKIELEKNGADPNVEPEKDPWYFNEVIAITLNYGEKLSIKMEAWEDDCGDDNEYESNCGIGGMESDDIHSITSEVIDYKGKEPGEWHNGPSVYVPDKFSAFTEVKIKAPQPNAPNVGKNPVCSGEEEFQFSAPNSGYDQYVDHYEWQKVREGEECTEPNPYYCYECEGMAEPEKSECQTSCIEKRCWDVLIVEDLPVNGKYLKYAATREKDKSDKVRYRKVYNSGVISPWSDATTKNYEYFQADEVESISVNTDETNGETNNNCGAGKIILTANAPDSENFNLEANDFIWERRTENGNWETLAQTNDSRYEDTDPEGFSGNDVEYRVRTKHTSCSNEYSGWAYSGTIYIWEPPADIDKENDIIIDYESCDNNRDGKITILPLSSGTETLYFNFKKLDGPIYSSGAHSRSDSIAIPDDFEEYPNGGLDAGKYIIQVINADKYDEGNDGQYCFIEDTITVGTKDKWRISETEILNNVSCHEGNDGRMAVNASGRDEGQIQFLLAKAEDGAFNFDNPDETSGFTSDTAYEFKELAAGTYKIRVDDIQGCEFDTSSAINITQPEKITLDHTYVKSDYNNSVLSCYNARDGQVEISIKGGIGKFTYRLFDNNSKGLIKDTTVSSRTYTFTGIGEGNYYVQVADSCNETVTSDNFTLSAPNQPTFTISKNNDVTCHGANDGQITVSASEGVAPYQFRIDNENWQDQVETYDVFSALPPGEHNVELQDANGCMADPQTIYIDDPDSLALIFTKNSPSCPDGTNGSITVTASGGTYNDGTAATTAYQVKLIGYTDWKDVDPDNQFTFYNYGAGTYDISVRDANNTSCAATYGVTLTEPDPIELDVTNITEPDCMYGKNGQVTLEASGGSPGNGGNYYYSLNGEDFYPADENGNFITADTLEAGQYTFYVRDGNYEEGNTATQNCEKQFPFALHDPDPVEIFTTSARVICYGTETGSITIDSVRGGAGNYTYQWFQGSSTNVANLLHPDDPSHVKNLSRGTYRLRVEDANGCLAYKDISIKGPQQALQINDLKIYPVSCEGREDGKVQIEEVAGGYPSYSYSLDDGPFRQDNFFDSLAERETPYMITVRDGAECEVAHQFNMGTEDPALSIPEKQGVRCYGGADGKFTLEVEGGSNLSYFLNGELNASGNEFKDLAAGNHQITIDYNNGCQKDTIITISQPEEPLSASYEILREDGYCANTVYGMVRIQGEGGTPPYQFRLEGQNYDTTAVIEDLASGSYAGQVKDAVGCEYSLEIEMPAMEKPAITMHVLDSAACDLPNGSVKAGVKGGIPPYSFYWDENNTGNNDSIGNRLSAGTHQLLVEDRLGCVFEKEFVLENSESPTLSLETLQKPYCGKNTGVLMALIENVNGNPQYKWYDIHKNLLDTTRQLDNIPAGKYSLEVLDEKGCKVREQIQLQELPPPEILVTEYDSSGCNLSNGAIQLQLINGTAAKYTWSHDTTLNQPRATQLAAGAYLVNIEDTLGCKVSKQITMADGQGISATVVRREKTFCDLPLGSAEVKATGGAPPYTYHWNDPDSQKGTVADSLVAGTYIVSVEDAKGCIYPLQVSIVNHPPPQVNLVNKEATYCGLPLGNAEVAGSHGAGPFAYEWYDQDNHVINRKAGADSLYPGNYKVIAFDSLGCASRPLQVTIPEASPPELTLVDKSNAYCGLANGTAGVKMTGGEAPYQYMWDNGEYSSQAGNLSKGIHKVTAIDAHGCQVSLNVNIGASLQPYLSLEKSTPSACGMHYGAATVRPHGGEGPYAFQWNDGQSQTGKTARELAAGNYQVTATDANGCAFSLNVTVEDRGPIAIQTNSMRQPTCHEGKDGTIKIDVTGGTPPYRYQWQGFPGEKGNVLPGMAAGNYEVIVMDSLGCIQSHLVNLTEPAPMEVINVNRKRPTCFGGSDGRLTVSVNGGKPPYQYQWNDEKSSGKATIKNITPGNHWVTITDDLGCALQKQIALENPQDLPDVLARDSVVICKGQPYGLDAGPGWTSYAWASENGFTSNRQQVTISNPGIYTIKVTNSAGCATIDTFQLVTDEQPMTVKFLTPSEIVAGDTIVLTDVTWPAPDRLAWEYADSMQHVGSTEYKEILILPKAGTYTLTMKAFLGDCMGIMEKTITVSHPDSLKRLASNGRVGYDGIEEVKIFPNPNSGRFTLEIFLAGKQDLTINILGTYSRFVYRKKLKNRDYFKKALDLSGIREGVYVLGIRAGDDYESFRFIKQ